MSHVTPPGSANGRGHRRFFDIDHTLLREMLLAHVCGRTFPSTEFSSWSPSLVLVLCWANWQYKYDSSAWIAILDTHATPNVIFSVIDVQHVRSIGDIESDDHASLEYMVHGKIQGPHYRCVRFGDIRNAVGQVYPRLLATVRNRDAFGDKLRTYWFRNPSFNAGRNDAHDLYRLKAIAQTMANRAGQQDLVVPLTAALFCIYPRPDRLWNNIAVSDAARIAQVTAHLYVDQTYCRDPGVLAEVVETRHIPEVGQMIRLLRALVNYQWGRGARGRGY